MNILKKFSYILMAAVAIVATASCSDPDSEITSIELSRALRPTDVTVKVQDKVNARVSAYFVTVPEKITLDFKDVNGNGGDKTVNYQVEEEMVGKTHQTLNTNVKLASETAYQLTITSEYKGKKSEPVVVDFETDPEQILADVTDDKITSSTVLLTWPAGEEVTTIEVRKKIDDVETVLQTITLTAEQKALGQCLVEDLQKESTYTFYILNGDKVRGKQVVKTLPEYIPVYAGKNVDLQSIIDGAEAGKTIMLLPAADGSNEFYFESEEGAKSIKDLTISKDITIAGMASKPVVANIAYKLSPNANFTTENITYKCSGKVLVSTSDAGEYGDVTFNAIAVDGCNMLVQINGENIMTMKSITVKNCFIQNVSAALVRNDKAGVIDKIVFEQNTVNGGGTTRGFCIGNKTVKCLNTISVKNNTFNNLQALTDGLYYIRSVTGGTDYTANIEKNFCVNFGDKSVVSKDGQTNGNDYKSNFYFNCPLMLDNGTKPADTSGKEVTGGTFVDAANGNFTIANDDVNNVDAGNTEFAKFWVK